MYRPRGRFKFGTGKDSDAMNPKLKEKLMESLTAVLPITLIVLALSVSAGAILLSVMLPLLGGLAAMT